MLLGERMQRQSGVCMRRATSHHPRGGASGSRFRRYGRTEVGTQAACAAPSGAPRIETDLPKFLEERRATQHTMITN